MTNSPLAATRKVIQEYLWAADEDDPDVVAALAELDAAERVLRSYPELLRWAADAHALLEAVQSHTTWCKGAESSLLDLVSGDLLTRLENLNPKPKGDPDCTCGPHEYCASAHCHGALEGEGTDASLA